MTSTATHTRPPTTQPTRRSSKDVAESTCPQCKSTTEWKGSSWCPDCGFYPGVTDALPESERRVPVPAANVPAVVERKPLMPPWLVQSITIPTLIIVASIATRIYFTYYGGERGFVSLFLFLSGIVAAIGAHIRSALAAIDDSADLSPISMLTEPIEMWRSTIRDLPDTGGRIVSAVSGVTAVLCALTVIGGLDFGALIKHDKVKEDKNKKGVIARIKDLANGKGKKAGKQGEDGPLANATSGDAEPISEAAGLSMPSPELPLQCVVYGIMNDGGKQKFSRILLAAKVNGAKVHVGTMNAADLPRSLRDRISAALGELVVESPVVESSYRATWLRPRIGLPIKFDGWTLTGEFSNPQLYSKNSK